MHTCTHAYIHKHRYTHIEKKIYVCMYYLLYVGNAVQREKQNYRNNPYSLYSTGRKSLQ